MFIILLRFSTYKDRAAAFMEAHKAWIEKGIKDGVFLLVGSIKPNGGGAILAQSPTLTDIQRRVDVDPFVENGVVVAEVVEVAPSRVDDRLSPLARST